MLKKFISFLLSLTLFSSMSAFATRSQNEANTIYAYSLNENFSGEFGYKSNTYKSLLIGESISQYLNYKDTYRSTSRYSYSIANDAIFGPYFEASGNNTSMSWSGVFMEAPDIQLFYSSPIKGKKRKMLTADKLKRLQFLEFMKTI